MIRLTIPVVALGLVGAGVAGAEMPAELVELLARPDVPATVRGELDAGQSPVWVLERESGAEQISVAGIVRLSAPARRVADDFYRRDSLLESDILKVSGNFSEPPVPADVAKYRVPEGDLEILADCEVHACKFKLGAAALEELAKIDWDSPDARNQVDELVRGRMLEFVAAYEQEGRPALGRYLDKPNARSVSDATGHLLDQIQSKPLVETVRAHFRDYPKTPVRAARDRIHWNVREYGYRPVTSIVHTAAFDLEGSVLPVLLAAETLYSSHYFYARLQLLVLYADTANPNQTYAVYADRLLFDDKVGTVQRRVLRSGIVGDVRKRLGAIGRTYGSP